MEQSTTFKTLLSNVNCTHINDESLISEIYENEGICTQCFIEAKTACDSFGIKKEGLKQCFNCEKEKLEWSMVTMTNKKEEVQTICFECVYIMLPPFYYRHILPKELNAVFRAYKQDVRKNIQQRFKDKTFDILLKELDNKVVSILANFVECPVCYEIYPTISTKLLNDGCPKDHRVCNDCLTSYLKSTTKNTCPVEKCEKPIKFKDLQDEYITICASNIFLKNLIFCSGHEHIPGSKVVDLYEICAYGHKLCKECIGTNLALHDTFQCPINSCGCDLKIYVFNQHMDKTLFKEFYKRANKALTESNKCGKCREENKEHGNCIAYLKKMEKIHEDQKVCPQCLHAIEKNEGCFHMTCGYCRYDWCWKCCGEWKSETHTNFYKVGCVENSHFNNVDTEEYKQQQIELHKKQQVAKEAKVEVVLDYFDIPGLFEEENLDYSDLPPLIHENQITNELAAPAESD
jgi:hypothetical protein